MRPESLMMSFGYRPEWSEGAVKPPVFLTSTFVFGNAREAKEAFAQAYGLPGPLPKGPPHLIYSRLGNPDLEILEARLDLWDRAAASAVFASGMAAISTSLLALVPMGSSIVFARPVYGGTDYLLDVILPEMGIPTRDFPAGSEPAVVEELMAQLAARGSPCKLVFFETPANPTTTLTDIADMAELAHRHGALCVVDNTLLGPLYQQPLCHGADLVVYSATKYLGGHSDLVAGVALGSAELIERVKLFRTIFGTMLDPHSAWLLLRSLETAKLRMTCARKNAERIADWLFAHPRVSRVYFPGRLESRHQRRIYRRQCSGPGALMAFDLADAGEAEAYRLLDSVRLIKLAVSLGGTESLIEHPATMTHADVPENEQAALGITPAMIRLSVGIEHPDDLIADLSWALDQVDAADPEVATVGREEAPGR
ncbi:MAG: aminotransferase class I/II-fold pyridoxal phosphate-dependent enzyme [Acidobacteriota bacterium]|nr:aminotransferase class I/II-fold pyridoxal phosphate-dependent enzyme [Acidobacteriota bacterium]MDH3523069.1 aminotransferase class I/II-fold pyridoxal phosphate-dependent enzyme [Acidobacteriota bacterium]